MYMGIVGCLMCGIELCPAAVQYIASFNYLLC